LGQRCHPTRSVEQEDGMQTLLLTMAAMTPTTSYFANLIVMTLRDGLIVAMGWLYIGFFQPDICGLFE